MAEDSNIHLDRLPSGERTPERLQVAIIAVLLEAAHANGEVKSEELARVSTAIFSHLGLSDERIGHLIEVGEILRKDPEKRASLLSEVGENFSLAQRQELLSVVWRILIIDGEVDGDEALVAVEIRKALALSVEAAVAARIRAEQTEAALLVQSLKKVSEEEADGENEE